MIHAQGSRLSTFVVFWFRLILHISLKSISLVLGLSYNKLNASDSALKDFDKYMSCLYKNWWYNHNERKHQTVCIVNGTHCLNTLRPRQNCRHFADDIFKCIFLNENVWISLKISLKFVPKGRINNIPVLAQIMAWRRPSELMNEKSYPLFDLGAWLFFSQSQIVKIPRIAKALR